MATETRLDPTDRPMSDAPESCRTMSLIARYRAGDAAALQELLTHHYPRVERIVRVRLGHALLARTTVSDLVQDVFLRVIESLDSYEERDDASWIDWVAKLVEREIANQVRYFRAAKRDGHVVPLAPADDSECQVQPPAESTGIPSKVSRRELEEIVDECLGQLAGDHREVILLRDYAGLSWERVAEELGDRTAGAAQEVYRRARQKLANRVRKRI